MSFIKFFSIENSFSKGQKYFNLNKPDLALIQYDKALSMNPKNDGVYLHKALAHARLQDYKNAILAIDKAIGLNPNNSVYHLFAGVIKLESGDSIKALECFEASIGLDEKYVFAKQYKALALLKTGKINQAVEILRQTGIASNGIYKCLFSMTLNDIRAGLEKNDYEEITRLIKKLFTKDKGFFERIADKIKPSLPDQEKKALDELYQRAYQLTQLGAYEKSIEVCSGALSNKHEHTALIKLIAKNYFHMREYNKSEKYYKEIAEEISSDIESLLNLGISLHEQKKLDEAKKILIKAFDISGLHEKYEVAKWLGEVCLALNEKANAIYYLSMAYEDMGNASFKEKCETYA